MAENVTIARPYAEAVFSIAVEEKELDKWQILLQAMNEACKNDFFVDHIKLSANSEKASESFISILGDLADDEGKNFIRVIGENNRFEVIPEIYDEYVRLRKKYEKNLDAQLISARAFSDTELKLISDKLEKKYNCKVTLNQVVDSSLIGGAVLKVGDKIIDASVRTSLNNLSSTLK